MCGVWKIVSLERVGLTAHVLYVSWKRGPYFRASPLPCGSITSRVVRVVVRLFIVAGPLFQGCDLYRWFLFIYFFLSKMNIGNGCGVETKCDCIIEDLLMNNFSRRSSTGIEEIILVDRPKPNLNIKSSTKNFIRHFRPEFYENISWLCGCIKLQKFFCWPCILFSKEINVWSRHGFNDLNNLCKSRKRHEITKHHIDSFIKWKQLSNEGKLRNHLDNRNKTNVENHNKIVAANRYVISRLIDVICCLSKQELSCERSANYIQLLRLISCTDTQLKVHSDKSTIFPQLSDKIQNDLICTIGNYLLEQMKKEIETASFVSVIVNETTDTSYRAKFSTVLRYVNELGHVRERFVGFEDVNEDRHANSLFWHVKKYLDDYACNNKLIALSYDGSVVLSDQHQDVQTKFNEVYKQVIIVHCYAHRLNSILSQSVHFIGECRIFFQTLTGFSSFFTKSIKRSDAMDQAIKTRFPSGSPTKWDYDSRVVNSIVMYKDELKDLLLNMTECPEQWDAETAVAARGLHQYLTDFDFDFLLLFFSQIFSQSDLLSDVLKEKNLKIVYCIGKIDRFINFLKKMRNGFDLFWNAVSSEEVDVEAHPKKKLRLDKAGSMKDSYESLYSEIIDALLQCCTDRFSSMKHLQFVPLLDVTKFKEMEKKFPDDMLDSLKGSYENLFDLLKLKAELQYLYSSNQYSNKSVTELISIMVKDDLNRDILKELYNLIILINTLPSTWPIIEHKMSTIEQINCFSRTVQHEDSLLSTSLALISIEKQLLCSLQESATCDFHNRIIDDFATQSCRADLVYQT